MDKRIKLLGTISLLFISVLILFLPVFIKWKGIFHNDQAMSEWIRHYFFAQNFQKGIFPLWDPHVWCGGMPHYAYYYSGENYYFLLWPFAYLSNLNNLDNAYWMLCLLPLFLHYFIAIGGMFLLLKRVVKCNWIASFVGAFAYMYSPVFSYSYVSQDNLKMQAWLPWLLYVYMESIKKFTFWKLFLGGFIFAFIWLGGKLQYMPYIIIIWMGFISLIVLESHDLRKKNSLIKPIGTAFIMFVLGTVLSAVYLLSLLDGLKFTSLHLVLSFVNAVSYKIANMPLSYLVTLFLPDFFGNITGKNFIFDNLMFYWANISGGMVTTFIVFLGALVPAAIFSKTAQSKHYLRYAILAAGLYLFSILCVLGGNTPFYRLLIGWIPVVSILPYPIRYRMIQCFAASLLIGLGLHFLTSMNLQTLKYRLRKLAWIYILISFLVIIGVLFLFQKKEDHNRWVSRLDIEVKDFLPLREPVGVYTSKTARTKKLRLMFDGRSQGEIRYSDTSKVLPTQGMLIKSYAVLGKEWVEFDVDVPPNKFLWILPVSGEGRIGYWKDNEHCFLYDNIWRINLRTNAINIYKQSHEGKAALFYRLIGGYVERKPVVFSLFYWAAFAVFIILAIRLFSVKQFGYLAAILVIFEFFYFGTKAFYGCTFNEAQTEARSFLPHNVRARMPSEHPMFNEMISGVFPITDSTMRIATDYPFYDNFVYLNCRFALMGEPPHPLEKRFRKAIEAVYKRRMNEGMFFEGGGNLPFSEEFLNNFSVKYFFSRSVEKIFTEEQCVTVSGESDKYVHINKNALPRAYTINNITFSNIDEEFKELISGDLRKALYMSSDEGPIPTIIKNERPNYSFEDLQIKNLIERLDFSNPNEVNIGINIDIPSMMILTDVWSPGWQAFDGDRQIKIYRVNYCQRGIWLEKGWHQVRFRFRPLSWYIGLVISLGTALAMGVFLIVRTLKHDK
ncbi:MAG: hypothetical protein ACYDFR_02415 [Candidatus Omnitrophota bacterium]